MEFDMYFRRIIFSALIIGFFTGLLNSGVQLVDVTSIIFEAETYEVAEVDGHDSHEHEAEAWAPEDGLERTTYTFIANILSGVGFAAVLLAFMSQFQQQGVTQLSISKGVLWGLAGFVAFFVAPSLGLSPEIPGTQAAELEQRQIWWSLTVLATVVGLAVLAFAPLKFKLLGIVSIALPHIVGAPHIDGPEFTHPDPAAVEALTQLHHEFMIATGLNNFIFWLALGVCCAWAIQRNTLNNNG